jgi:hypothetical protein
MKKLKLFKFYLGFKPKPRNIEQHDVFFAIGRNMSDCKKSILDFIGLSENEVHIDTCTTIEQVDGYAVEIVPIGTVLAEKKLDLYFINLGGYMEGEDEEFHKQLLIPAYSLDEAKTKAKKDIFMQEHAGIKGATPHVDDKFLIDAEVEDFFKLDFPGYEIKLTLNPGVPDSNPVIMGYYMVSRL